MALDVGRRDAWAKLVRESIRMRRSYNCWLNNIRIEVLCFTVKSRRYVKAESPRALWRLNFYGSCLGGEKREELAMYFMLANQSTRYPSVAWHQIKSLGVRSLQTANKMEWILIAFTDFKNKNIRCSQDGALEIWGWVEADIEALIMCFSLLW